MSNPPQTVEDTISNATKNLESLRDSTAAALKLLLPLCSKNSDLAVMSIVAPAKKYVAAIDCSIIAAQEGFNIAEEAINLSQIQGANTAEATSYLDGMWAMARKGHKNAQDSVDKFKFVRTAIETSIREAKKGNENDSYLISLPEDIKILKEFSDSVNNYITWWNFMEMSASSTQKDRAKHHLLNYNSLRERSVIKKWEEMRDAYRSYKVEITLLQTEYKGYPWRLRFTPVDDKPNEDKRQGVVGVQKQTNTPKKDSPQGKAVVQEGAKPLKLGNEDKRQGAGVQKPTNTPKADNPYTKAGLQEGAKLLEQGNTPNEDKRQGAAGMQKQTNIPKEDNPHRKAKAGLQEGTKPLEQWNTPNEVKRQGAAGVQKQTNTPKEDNPYRRAGLQDGAKPLEQGNTPNEDERQRVVGVQKQTDTPKKDSPQGRAVVQEGTKLLEQGNIPNEDKRQGVALVQKPTNIPNEEYWKAGLQEGAKPPEQGNTPNEDKRQGVAGMQKQTNTPKEDTRYRKGGLQEGVKPPEQRNILNEDKDQEAAGVQKQTNTPKEDSPQGKAMVQEGARPLEQWNTPNGVKHQGAAGVQKQPKEDNPYRKAGLQERAKPPEQGNTPNEIKRQEEAHLTISNTPQTFEGTISNAIEDIRSLRISTAAALRLLLPLCSKNPNLTVMPIVGSAEDYVAAIDCSIIAAQKGFTIAEGAISFSKNGTADATIASYLEGMRAMACDGHKNTQEALDKFNQLWMVVNTSIREAEKHNKNDSHSKNIKILENFLVSITKYITWWNYMDISACTQEDRAKINLVMYHSLRERSIIRKWEELKFAHSDYKAEITLLQNEYKDYPWRSRFTPVDDKPNEDKLQDGRRPEGQSAERGEQSEESQVAGGAGKGQRLGHTDARQAAGRVGRAGRSQTPPTAVKEQTEGRQGTGRVRDVEREQSAEKGEQTEGRQAAGKSASGRAQTADTGEQTEGRLAGGSGSGRWQGDEQTGGTQAAGRSGVARRDEHAEGRQSVGDGRDAGGVKLLEQGNAPNEDNRQGAAGVQKQTNTPYGKAGLQKGANPQEQGDNPNIVVFGQTGSGKSSLINMLAGKKIAKVSSNLFGCTISPESYDITKKNKTYTFWDTSGLNEDEEGSVSAKKAAEDLLNLLKGMSVNLIIYLARGRFIDELQVNSYLFAPIRSACGGKVPIVVIVTGLEQEEVMDEWWTNHEREIERIIKKLKLSSFEGHACVTTIKEGNEGEYQKSTGRVWELVEKHCNPSIGTAEEKTECCTYCYTCCRSCTIM